MGKTHFVSVSTPAVGSSLYLLQGFSSQAYTPFTLVSVLAKGSAMTVVEHSFESLNQGHERDCYGNTSVSHNFAIGSVFAIPQTSKSLKIIRHDTSAKNQDSSQGYHWYLNDRSIHSDIVKKWWPQNSVENSYVCSCNVNTATTKQVNYGKPYCDIVSSTSFKVDYNNIYNSTYETTDVVNMHLNPAMASYSESTSTKVNSGRVRVIDLGIVMSSYYDIEYLRPTSLNAVEDPSTFLVDLYKKIGTPQINNCENLTQLKKWREMVPPFKDLIKKHNIKSLANLYLWWKYSFSTTKMDIEAYFAWFKSLSQQKVNSDNACHYSLTYNLAPNDVLRYNIYTSPYSIGVIEALGLDINLSNTWDILPFSFIVDWFISVGDCLHSIDVNTLSSKIELRSLIRSRKTIRLCPTIFEANVIGQVTWSNYSRSIEPQLPSTVCAVQFNNPSSHLLDATSLIVANRK